MMRSTSRIAVAALLLMAGSLAPSARAVDGVLEINQACAAGPGCFPGDAAGFPVTITGSGSYRLTSLLQAPDQDTTMISITGSGVTLDLNGFAIRGTGGYGGPPSTTCSGAGSGVGVSATGSDVVVSNGYIVGMGSHGVAVNTNSRVEWVTVNNCCGNAIAIGIGSLAHESVVIRNRGNGIMAGAASRVSACLAVGNGESGVTSSPGATRLAVDGCIATENRVDGIFGGTRSLVRGSLTNSNSDDGIDLAQNGQVVESTAISNTDRGVTVLGALVTFDSTAVGLNVADLNALDLSGGVLVACNVIDGVNNCPP
jgi:hypothetical protein